MSQPLPEETPFVTIVIPCRNEASFIATCLDSVVAADYPRERLEVFVVDGRSEDGTRAIVSEYAERYRFIRLLDNPMRITPSALNIGIRAARGDFVVWMAAHSSYPPNYVPESIRYMLETDADHVGGVMVTVPREDSAIARAIVACLSHRFGVGNSYFRIHTPEPRWVDTVFGGTYRRELFSEVGLFNEMLARGQDMEFQVRLKQAGKKTLLVPTIVSHYYARTRLKGFWEHNWINGVWAIKPFLYTSVTPVGWRHLVPLVFVLTLLVTLALGLVWPAALWLLGAILVLYAIAALTASADVALTRRDWRYLVTLPPVFASLHVGYGLGSIAGLLQVLPRLLLDGRQVGLSGRLGED